MISGRELAEVRSVESRLKALPRLRVSTHLLDGAAETPWPGTEAPPEALILVLAAGGAEPLRGLAERPRPDCPPLVVVGPGNDLELMRLAMRCGARDFLAAPADSGDLEAVIGRIAEERRDNSGSTEGSLSVVVNAKGGAGGSLIACNVAHMMAAELKMRTALVDLDLQFGVLPLYFDLQANDGLLQAIDTVDTLDEVAVEGWMLKHRSGLHVLASSHQQLILPGEVPEAGVGALMSLLKRAYPQVVVDLPRQIDPVFAAVVERADQVVVVIQQSLADLRHAKNLLMILTGRLGLEKGQIRFVVNRWERNGTLREREIEQALDGVKVATLPNDWLRVTRSLDIGTPLLDEDPRAPITRGMSELAARLSGVRPAEKKGLFGRFMSR
jgi:pilus assembly protein CpaE